MRYRIQLSEADVVALNQQDPSTAGDGGFQGLLVKLQKQIDPETNELQLDDDDVRRIRRCREQYGDGGWQRRLPRVLVDNLDGLERNAAA